MSCLQISQLKDFIFSCIVPLIITFFGITLFYSLYLDLEYPNEQENKLTYNPIYKLDYDYLNRPRYLSGLAQMAVSADNGNCSEIGLQILQKGGNAADSAIATSFCQGILNNFFSGLGGGCFIHVYTPGKGHDIIDSREYASSNSYPHMYDGKLNAERIGPLALGIPMELKGLQALHDRHGKLPWQQLVEPSIPLARNGHYVHPLLSRLITQQDFPKEVQLNLTESIIKHFYIRENGKSRPPLPGDLCCKNPNLADLLDNVAKKGAKALYNTNVIKRIVKDINQAGGNVTIQDYFYQGPIIRKPIVQSVFGYEFVVPPLPSSGFLILAALKILEQLKQSDIRKSNNIQKLQQGLNFTNIGIHSDSANDTWIQDDFLWTHRLVEVFKHINAIRQHLGDPGLEDQFLDLDQLKHDVLSDGYVRNISKLINDNATIADVYKYGGKYNLTQDEIFKDGGTTHMNVVDSDGMCVALTSTLNGPFGSQFFSESTGILFNNQMADFAVPNKSDIFNSTPSVYNKILPYRKPLSSMTPLIVKKNDKPVLVTGSSGGTTILTSLILLIWKHLVQGRNLRETIFDARIHHQLIPDHVWVENINFQQVQVQVQQQIQQSLIQRQHKVVQGHAIANIQAIRFNYYQNGSLQSLDAISDVRKDGAPYGI